nr:hypothetical protein [Pandoravirus massiliensis]
MRSFFFLAHLSSVFFFVRTQAPVSGRHYRATLPSLFSNDNKKKETTKNMGTKETQIEGRRPILSLSLSLFSFAKIIMSLFWPHMRTQATPQRQRPPKEGEKKYARTEAPPSAAWVRVSSQIPIRTRCGPRGLDFHECALCVVLLEVGFIALAHARKSLPQGK